MRGMKKFFLVGLPIVLGLALHHGQCAPGKGKNLNDELVNQLQRACIRFYGFHELPNQLQRASIHLCGWAQFFLPSQLP